MEKYSEEEKPKMQMRNKSCPTLNVSPERLVSNVEKFASQIRENLTNDTNDTNVTNVVLPLHLEQKTSFGRQSSLTRFITHNTPENPNNGPMINQSRLKENANKEALPSFQQLLHSLEPLN